MTIEYAGSYVFIFIIMFLMNFMSVHSLVRDLVVKHNINVFLLMENSVVGAKLIKLLRI